MKHKRKLFLSNGKGKGKRSHTADTSAFGRRQCRQIALIQGCDTTRAPLLEASPFPRETRGTHCIDLWGMKGWVNPVRDLNSRPRSRESDPDWNRTTNPAIQSPTRCDLRYPAANIYISKTKRFFSELSENYISLRINGKYR